MRNSTFKNIVKNTKNILRVFVFTTKVTKHYHREYKDLAISIFSVNVVFSFVFFVVKQIFHIIPLMRGG